MTSKSSERFLLEQKEGKDRRRIIISIFFVNEAECYGNFR